MFLFYLFWAIFFLIWIQPRKGIVSYSFEDKIFATVGIFNLVFLSPLSKDLIFSFPKLVSLFVVIAMFLCFDIFAIIYIRRLLRKKDQLNKKEAVFLSIFYFIVFYVLPQTLALINIY